MVFEILFLNCGLFVFGFKLWMSDDAQLKDLAIQCSSIYSTHIFPFLQCASKIIFIDRMPLLFFLSKEIQIIRIQCWEGSISQAGALDHHLWWFAFERPLGAAFYKRMKSSLVTKIDTKNSKEKNHQKKIYIPKRDLKYWFIFFV